MSKAEILAELPKLSVEERDEVRRRLAELDEENADAVALTRAEELGSGLVQPKTQAEVFRNARHAVVRRWFHPAFEVELIEAARYLEQQRSDFGRQFLDEVEAAIEDIVQAPATWRPWHGDIRRFVLTRFRYTIRYRLRRDEDLVEFLSVIHTSRHPDAGLGR